ncbi:MAG: tetratricopeptide repeat protein [Anaerolineae bacterium]|nr:tetratricopeptide repeat protein [Anaerolineae bacterium]
METPLLQTKLYIPPPRPDVVSRPRLIERLNEGQTRKLTLISAPAGFGKTTLVSNWIDDLRVTIDESRLDAKSQIANRQSKIKNRVTWLSLDEADNDPTRFLSYLIAALQQIEPDIGQTGQVLLQSPRPPPVETLLTTLVNDITGLPQEIVLVLDDYHLIETQLIHEALAFLVNHQPPQIHLVITSRADPPLPLARLRARNELTELREEALRFTAEETTMFLNEVMGLKLSPEDVAELESRTEGWITGLQLAALSMQGRRDRAGFINSFSGSHRFILDYLTDEVLSQQPPALREFLTQASILNRLTGSLCQAVTGRDDSQALLEQLEAANLFLIPLDNQRQWYRFHHLFADLLRSRLPHVMEAATLTTLHQRASAWFAQAAAPANDSELMTEAINHALAAQDFEQAARLIAQIADVAIWQRGELNRVLAWLEQLPRQAELAQPRLALTHALILVWRGELDAAESLIQSVISQAGSQPAQIRDSLRGQAATIRAAITDIQGDAPAAMGHAQEALEYLTADDRQVRGLAMGILAGIYRSTGTLAAGCQAYAEAVTLLQAAGQRVPVFVAFGYLGQLQTQAGHLNEAGQTFEQAINLAEAWGALDFPTLGVVHINFGNLLRERDALDQAADHLQKGIELCQRWTGLTDDILESLVALARVRQAQGKWPEAVDLLQQAGQLGQAEAVAHWETWVGVGQARLWLAQGELSAVEAWTRHRNLQPQDAPGQYPRALEYLILARLYLYQGQLDQALSLAARLYPVAEEGGHTAWAIEALNLQAMAYHQQGQTDQAIMLIVQALSLAEAEGFQRIFLDEGEVMLALLRQAQARHVSQAYLEALIPRFTSAADDLAAKPQPLLIEPLSYREREVLDLLALGHTNAQIATALVISITTVKTHVRNIYGKLNVDNRVQAVARARALNLL